MRALAPFVIFATPAAAWEASIQGPVCVLSHDEESAQVVLTHDPSRALPYVIEVTRTETRWTPAEIFAIRFEGPGQLTISTNRHELTGNGTSLSVADTGFGNVLNGLEFNHFASAVLGDQVVIIPLAGAAPEVARFRDCASRVGT